MIFQLLFQPNQQEEETTSGLNYYCECQTHYEGKNCQYHCSTDCHQDYCLNTETPRCKNGGKCISILKETFCICPKDRTGTDCSIHVSPCASSPCGKGKCIEFQEDSGIFICMCGKGYRGQFCEDRIDKCSQDYSGKKCSVHGTKKCIDNLEDGEPLCICNHGYGGSDCSLHTKLCDSMPCQNGGVCHENSEMTYPLNSYYCDCSKATSEDSDPNIFYDGINCQQKQIKGVTVAENYINRCDPEVYLHSSACKNGGICVDALMLTQSNNFKCLCPYGYEMSDIITWPGPQCKDDQIMDPCASNPCDYDNTDSCLASNKGRQYSCICKEHYTGIHCQTKIDYCLKLNLISSKNVIYCENSEIDIGQVILTCREHFTGEKCDDEIDPILGPCASNPCASGSTCVKMTYKSLYDRYAFYCACPLGKQGFFCEKECPNSVCDQSCHSNPCWNDGKCISSGSNSYKCICPEKTNGIHCERIIDPCNSNPCNSNGDCFRDLYDYSFTCKCFGNFQGTTCQDSIDFCTSILNKCYNGGTCISSIAGARCECPVGFHGKQCQLCDEPDDCIMKTPCDSSPCLRGSCTDQFSSSNLNLTDFDSFTCTCDAGYTGTTCNKEINYCDESLVPRLNNCNPIGGSCYKKYGVSNTPQSNYGCECKKGFSGEFCEIEVKSCESNPCQNNAFCRELEDISGFESTKGFVCECVLATESGEFCENVANPNAMRACSSNPCKNNGLCVDMPFGFKCLCPYNMFDVTKGPDCTVYKNPCNSAPCGNNGDCGFTPNLVTNQLDITCNCATGWEGDFCQENIDDCEVHLCNNNGFCTDLLNDFTCKCDPGFTGKTCEIDIDECSSNPCVPGQGTCSQGLQSRFDFYYCTCEKGYEGIHCELDTNECASGPCVVDNLKTPCIDRKDKIGEYYCDCKDGFLGVDCSIDINECRSNPCISGTCRDGVNEYTCECWDDFYSRNPENQRCESKIDDCSSFPCQNDGICIDGIARYDCDCSGTGFKGSHCEIEIDECQFPKFEDIDENLILMPCQNIFIRAKSNQDDTLIEHLVTSGTCENLVNKYRCDCLPGFENGIENECEIDINRCQPNECQHNSICFDEIGDQIENDSQMSPNVGFQCQCLIGFTGPLCEINIDECASNPCVLGHGTCHDRINSYSCTCFDGFVGENCQIDIDECASNPCVHEITCLEQQTKPDFYECQCLDGYRGMNCEIEVNECTENDRGLSLVGQICQNNGICEDLISGHVCHCESGYTGSRCEIDINECQSQPCKNGANCADHINLYSCLCKTGYVGVNCETDFDECASNPCAPNGDCRQPSLAKYLCDCHRGYTGTNCEIDINECQSNPCGSNGFCKQVTAADGENGLNNLLFVGDYYCICDNGYEGTNCQTEINECVTFNQPCRNGVCHDEVNKYRCECDAGWTGTNCEIDVNECSSAPCGSENGVCINLENAYRCACNPGFTGAKCQTDINECDSNPCEVTAEIGPPYGTCYQPSHGTWKCLCPIGMTFTSSSKPACNIDLDECQSNACQNDAECIESNNLLNYPVIKINEFKCNCKTGFTGKLCEQNINECLLNNPCQHDSVCIDLHGSYECNCAGTFYEGKHCDEEMDLCHSNPCKNQGICTPSLGKWSCDCPEGFELLDCSGDINECGSSPCHYGSCSQGWDDFLCECFPGYTGKSCNLEIDACESDPCDPYGSCIKTGHNLYRCHCTPGTGAADPRLHGYKCDYDINECASVPCMNGATCREKRVSPGQKSEFGFYQCLCPKGFSGTNCENQDNECASYPCDNGDCIDLVAGYKCTNCPGFTGTNCQIPLNPCESNPCTFGKCIQNPNFNLFSFTCLCFEGAKHSNNNDEPLSCQIDIDECASSPCQNGGICIGGQDPMMLNYFQCNCDGTGFTGPLCEIDVDECISNPCMSRATFTAAFSHGLNEAIITGTCRNLNQEYVCECHHGYTGNNCETAIDYCSSNPCQNQAKCQMSTTLVGHYACSCLEGYTGTNCEASINDCVSNPCIYGNCLDGHSEFKCQCYDGYFGNRCNSLNNYCKSSPCKFGTCIESVQGYKCKCPTGISSSRPGLQLCDIDIDECSSDPCENSGICLSSQDPSLPDFYSCQCNSYWTGKNCEIEITPCSSSPCSKNSKCKSYRNFYECLCNPGFTGKNCNIDINECASNPCAGSQPTEMIHQLSTWYNCSMPAVDLYVCSCAKGIRGSKPGLCDIDVDECISSPCKNEAVSCEDSSKQINFGKIPLDSYRCQCNPYYTGANCQTPIDYCGSIESNPCHAKDNSNLITGKCRAKNIKEIRAEKHQKALLWVRNSPNFRGYVCECKPGWTGVSCQTIIDSCSSNPCKSLHGDCKFDPTNHRYTCQCKKGYYGRHCENSIDYCASSPCIHGNCQTYPPAWPTDDKIKCECHKGFTGKFCETPIDKCGDSNQNYCNTEGSYQCINDLDDYRCLCLTGFTGNLCQINIDDCASNPCNYGNSVLCIDQIDNFVCTCKPGYTGKTCQSIIDPCKSNAELCQNGGTCHRDTQNLGKFTCECSNYFTGQYCERDIDECYQSDDPNSELCSNAGICQNRHGGYDCINCLSGYTGKYCNNQPDPCGVNAVHNSCIKIQTKECISSINGQRICLCNVGFSGDTCEIRENFCASRPCMNNGICKSHELHMNIKQPTDIDLAYTCDCPDGWKGKNCEIDIDECYLKTSNCHPRNTEKCVNSPEGSYTCYCKPGSSGKYCEIQVNICQEIADYCKNKGVCHPSTDYPGKGECICRTGTTGQFCEKRFDACASNPVINGVCQPETQNVGSYQALCSPGYEGPNCETEIDECKSNPCQTSNSIQCQDQFLDYICVCKPDFTGKNCETKFNPCLSFPCRFGACQNLEDNSNSYKCQCKSGYTGKYCETKLDECSSKPCLNGGFCNDLPGISTLECQCPVGFTGLFCEINIDDCTVRHDGKTPVCQNNGKCYDLVGDFKCECPPEYSGKTCEWRDSCREPLCLNGGTCQEINKIGDYRCNCKPLYHGQHCEFAAGSCESVVCWNGGICMNDQGQDNDDWSCLCTQEYTGIYCESLIGDGIYIDNGSGGGYDNYACSSSPCDENGVYVCKDVGLIFECICQEGYEGKLCEVAPETDEKESPSTKVIATIIGSIVTLGGVAYATFAQYQAAEAAKAAAKAKITKKSGKGRPDNKNANSSGKNSQKKKGAVLKSGGKHTIKVKTK